MTAGSGMAKRLARTAVLVAALVACVAAGCQRDAAPDEQARDAEALATLPKPDAGSGSVTGFDGSAPRPATSGRDARAADAATQDPDVPMDGQQDDVAGFDLSTPGDTGAIPAPATAPQDAAPAPAPSPAPAAPQPGGAEAAAVVRSYYGAINAGQYPRAYALWGDGGRASGQSASQFAHGYGDTSRITVNTGEPGRVEGAAGSRYVTVPVAVEAIHHDGSIHHFDGTFTLRRSVVDGASAAQREWRISDADLREVE